jgi:glutathione S-transferase
MIKLYCFGRAPGLPDMSPFVAKAMLLLKLAGLDYVEDRTGFMRAPRGKLPYIDDDGVIVADSTQIRRHIEKRRGVDFDAGLSAEQRAIAWAAERMCEDHLYWLLAQGRWCDDANFARGPARIFDSAPAPLRPIIRAVARRKVSGVLHAQGTGRFSPEEASRHGRRDIETLATLLGDKPYFFGDKPCGADATLFGFLAGVLADMWESPIRDAALAAPNLVAYRDRLMRAYFPDVR